MMGMGNSVEGRGPWFASRVLALVGHAGEGHGRAWVRQPRAADAHTRSVPG